MDLFGVSSTLMFGLSLGMLAAQAFAFLSALSQRADAYVAADKLTKPAWCLILGLGVAAHLLFWSPLSLFNLAGIIAALVYLLDVRPAILSLTRR